MNTIKNIEFTIGEESHPVIEQQVNGSIFQEQYRKAFAEIDTYLGKEALLQHSGVENNNEYYNNILVFTGERGAGKTSCMMSVANMLLRKDAYSENQEVFAVYPQIMKCVFQTIDLIDPSYFDKKHNIIAIIVAKLFRRFEEASRRSEPEIDFEERRKLVECFDKTQKHLQCLLSKETEHVEQLDDLNRLVDLSAAVDLKNTLYELIKTYLSYFKKGESRQIMLFMVDDIDLNTSEACEMAEQIRKYLILPNVVILLSLKQDQLGLLKWQQYAEAYRNLLDRNQMTPAMISEMVERYLTKFIPYNHRIFMPEFEVYSDAQLTIGYKGDKKTYPSVRYAVPALIFHKTRYLFYNTPHHTSYIVPRNLRELRLLVALLVGMADYHEDNSDKTAVYNKSLFHKYLFETWVLDNLDMTAREQIDDLLQIDDASQINKRVITILNRRFGLSDMLSIGDKEHSEFYKELASLIRIDNVAYNISLGDVLSLIAQLEKRFSEQKDRKFLFILQTFYSIRLGQYFDEMSESKKEEPAKNVRASEEAKVEGKAEGKAEDKVEAKEIFRKDVLEDLTNFDKLVAGNFFNARYDEFLPREGNLFSRTGRLINLNALQQLISECVLNWNTEDSSLIQLAEFFMLCTFRAVHSKNANFEPNFRMTACIRYAEPFSSSEKTAYFDINTFFYNITRIEECYKRFDNGKLFYEKADNVADKKSLWSKFKESTIRKKELDEFSMKHWLSWCTIRNSEVLQDLNTVLSQTKSSYRGYNWEVFAQFFQNISKYEISIYDKKSNGSGHYTISSGFASHIADLFNLFGGEEKAKNQPSVKLSNKVSDVRVLIKRFEGIFYISDIAETYDNIDVADFVKGLKKDAKNLTKTALTRLRKQYPIFELNPDFRKILDLAFAQLPERISRSDMRRALEGVNTTIRRLMRN